MKKTQGRMKIAVIAILAFVLVPATWAGTITNAFQDPADLHIGTGAGTAGAMGLGGDPNTIGTGGTFDIFYNPNANSSQLPIGNPFYLIFAIPIYSGSSTANSVSGTATMYSPYPGGATSTVTVNGFHDWGIMTNQQPKD